MKGRIVTRKEIWCGVCSHWEMLDFTQSISVKKELRDNGWKHTRKHGWLCKNCYHDLLSDKVKEAYYGNK